MADRDRTLAVAIAGIAATAVVGLAGTGAALWSARSDRSAQRALAREQRTYERRTAAYLDAIDYLEAQSDTVFEILHRRGSQDEWVQYQYPAPRLVSRLRAFGSGDAFTVFRRAQKINAFLPPRVTENPAGKPKGIYVRRRDFYDDSDYDPVLEERRQELEEQIERFEEIVHNEIG